MKIVTVVLGFLLIASNGYWLYSSLDSGVTATYHDQVTYEFANKIITLTAIADKSVNGISKDSAITLLRNINPENEPFEKEAAINSNWISLKLDEDGNVKRISIDDLVRTWAEPNR